MPEPVNHEWILDDPRLAAQAETTLGELEKAMQTAPDRDSEGVGQVLKMEAIGSCELEGIENDWLEVENLVKAHHLAIGELSDLPLSSRLLKMAHDQMLRSPKGENKKPGEFRNSQNWVGGKTLQEAIFIPPHPDEVPALMADLEKFIHNEYVDVNPLIRIGIAHYQFMTIHPFLAGNGRVGRLMIQLFLLERNLIPAPIPLSSYFKTYQGPYFNFINRVRNENDMITWLSFFLKAIRESYATF